ncbi:cathepsin L-like peptidase [Branchiostoma floridae x Branchiostoma belcheri]
MRLLVFVLSVAMATAMDPEWEAFKLTHGKQYRSPEEENARQAIFQDNNQMIKEHNQEAAMGRRSYFMGMNQFGDLAHSEYLEFVVGPGLLPLNQSQPSENVFESTPGLQVDDTVDWRQKGAVTPVGNEGQCGSPWAFSATGALEGAHFLKTGKLVSLSEQNLIDCSRKYGNQGCSGGYMDQSFKYIKKNGGIDTEECYPYLGKDSTCRFKPKCSGATLSNYRDIKAGDEMALMQAVGTVGPVSVANDASHSSFQFYKSGIYDEPECSSKNLDHAMLAVGYGSMDGKDYWIVKNSWGTTWGDMGYIKMSRNKNNQCGIATLASYPVV